MTDSMYLLDILVSGVTDTVLVEKLKSEDFMYSNDELYGADVLHCVTNDDTFIETVKALVGDAGEVKVIETIL